MLAVLELARIRFAGRPLLVFLTLFVVLLILRRVIKSRFSLGSATIASIAGAIVLVAYAGVAVWYASDPHFFDNAEPTMVAVGWLFHVGQPVYPALDAAERYAHIYGPLAFMFHGITLGALGPSIPVAKGLGAAAGLASLACLFSAMRREVGRGPALALTGSCALLLLMFRHYSFWPRPEPFQLVAVAAALLFAVSERGVTAATLVGVCAGILVNLKLTGPLYVLPVFAILQARAGWRAIFVAAGVGTIVAATPFAAFSNVSLTNYLAWVQLSAKTGLVLATLKQNLEWATYFSLPLLFSYYASPSEHRPGDVEWRNTMAALFAGLAGVAIAAAKPGAGPYHVLPFLPVVGYLTSRHLAARFVNHERGGVGSGVDAAALAFLISAAFIAVAQQAQLITTMSERRQMRDVDDVLRFAENHRGEIEIGYGDIEASTLIRPILTFRSNSYFIDQPAIREHQLQGVTIPTATIEALGRCRVNYWLIPKGETPFDARNSYPAVILMSLYPAAFRDRFFATHTLVESTMYFDAWQCHPGSAP